MRRVPIEQVTEKMVLAKPVVDSTGRPLLKKGDHVKEKLKERLKKWGVNEVFIVDEQNQNAQNGEEKTAQAPKNSGGKKEIDKVLKKRFIGHDKDPVMMALKRAVKEELSGQDD